MAILKINVTSLGSVQNSCLIRLNLLRFILLIRGQFPCSKAKTSGIAQNHSVKV